MHDNDARRPLLASHRPSPAGFADGVGQQELDLGVDASELVVGPLLEGVVQLGRNPQQVALPGGHGPVSDTASRC